MGRSAGTKNASYQQARDRIVRFARARLIEADGADASFRELARAAKVSVPTLRHYFAERSDLIAALFSDAHEGASMFLEALAVPPRGALAKSLSDALNYILSGLVEYRVIDLHVLGLRAGLKDAAIGPAYLIDVLEPSLIALDQRLTAHMNRGDLKVENTRIAAVQLLSPMLLVLLHQSQLGGAQCRPIEISAVIQQTIASFVAAHATQKAKRRRLVAKQ